MHPILALNDNVGDKGICPFKGSAMVTSWIPNLSRPGCEKVAEKREGEGEGEGPWLPPACIYIEGG
jgi:hypothetical protein